ncbi:MAG TPA: hypothetical protein VGW76_18450, partial [Pyrinomonadaceae bacterium]|nr:hypothetical protein [Pyrinomonadaceae bacterium]
CYRHLAVRRRCYNRRMTKAKKKKDNDAATERDRDDESSAEESESAVVELEPVKTKKGEPSDNLRRRGEWFQKRRSGS